VRGGCGRDLLRPVRAATTLPGVLDVTSAEVPDMCIGLLMASQDCGSPQVRSANSGGQGADVTPCLENRKSHRSQPQARVLVR